MFEKRWYFKRKINLIFHSLRKHPKSLKVLTKAIWFARYSLRGFSSPWEDNAGGVVVNEQQNIIYATNPKVASSSLKQYFDEYVPKSKMHEVSITQINEFTEKSIDKYYCFSVVRNSWERVYSCWKDKISNQDKFADIFIITRYKHLYPGMPFEEFVDWLCNKQEGSDKFADRHWISQHLLLGVNYPDIKYDKLIDIKNLEQDFNQLSNQLGLPKVNLVSRNKTSNSSNGIYTEKIINMLAKRYSEDIEIFNFTSPCKKGECN